MVKNFAKLIKGKILVISLIFDIDNNIYIMFDSHKMSIFNKLLNLYSYYIINNLVTAVHK